MNVLVWQPPPETDMVVVKDDPTDGVDVLTELARVDVHGVNKLCTSPDEAEVIVFPVKQAWHRGVIREHPWFVDNRDRAVVYDRTIDPTDEFRGAYTSLPRALFDAERHVATHHLEGSLPWKPPVPPAEPDLLFSFVGKCVNHPCRDRVMELDHPRGLVEDSSAYKYWTMHDRNFVRRKVRYWQVLYRSKFLLCPRGAGIATMRPYEALVAGRVPVILADDWVRPPRADWPAFSLTWPEDGDLHEMTEWLEEQEPRWEDLVAAGAIAHQECFRAEVVFHNFVEDVAALL